VKSVDKIEGKSKGDDRREDDQGWLNHS
jgi:hypothetical protein